MLDNLDNLIVKRYVTGRNEYPGIRVGDFVRFEDGHYERVSFIWTDGIQISPRGNFYLDSSGFASFSGSLNPIIPSDNFHPTDEIKDGAFWIFHHNISIAYKVTFYTPCRVFNCIQ